MNRGLKKRIASSQTTLLVQGMRNMLNCIAIVIEKKAALGKIQKGDFFRLFFHHYIQE